MIRMLHATRHAVLLLSVATPLIAQTPEEMAARSGFHLHSLFQSGMVLQRDKPIPFWGWGVSRNPDCHFLRRKIRHHQGE